MNTVVETRKRIQSIDILRGLVMVIMALDHTRDFFHQTAMTADPLDLSTSSVALYFTRWITHFCAPVFVFLSGTSAYLLGQKLTKKQLSLFLIKRGAWLVVAEIFVMSLALTFNPYYSIVFLQVFWAIGFSMIFLGLLVRLPFRIVILIGLLIFFGHNVFDKLTIPSTGLAGVLLNVFVTGSASFYPISDSHTVAVLYKILPWTSVMILGYGIGYFYANGVLALKRRKTLLVLGTSCILLFIVLRFTNAYGDPALWTTQHNPFFTVLSFINTTKYPPSLLFVSMTLGPALILLALLEGIQGRVSSLFITYGRVPFFYFVVHFYLIHVLCVLAFYLAGYTSSQINDPKSPFWFRPATFGFDLLTVYGVWLLVVILMYPLCKRYGRYKLSHRQWWLSYL